MNTTDIRISMETKDLKHIIARCHFREEDFFSLQALSAAVAPLLQVRAYSLWKNGDGIISYPQYAVVFLTLGSGIDALQELYLDRNCLSEAYMIECIALELLTKAYREFVKSVQKKTGRWAEKIDFLGDSYPVELLPELYQEFGQMDISYNEKLVLSPKNSVVFLLPMTDKKQENACSICGNCSNKMCLLRSITD